MSLNEDYYERHRQFDWDAHYEPPPEEDESEEPEAKTEEDLPPTEIYDAEYEEDSNASN